MLKSLNITFTGILIKLLNVIYLHFGSKEIIWKVNIKKCFEVYKASAYLMYKNFYILYRNSGFLKTKNRKHSIKF